MQRRCVFLVATLLSICFANRGIAVTYDWNNAAGGTFSTPANWTPAGGPPHFSDTARFSISGTYNVNFTGSTSVNTLTQTQGDVTLTLNTSTLTLGNTTSNAIGSAGLTSTLRINDGTFKPNNFVVAPTPTSTANLYLDNSSDTTLGAAAFFVGTSGTGTLTIQNGSTLTTAFGAGLGINSGGIGTATVTGAGSTWTINTTPLRVGSSGTGALNILAGGAVTAFGLEVGENLGSTGTVSLSGNLATFTTGGIANIGGSSASLPAASATLNVGNGSTMSLNGTANLRTNAKVNVTGGTLNLNTLNITNGATVNWTAGTINFATASTITSAVLETLLAGTHTLGASRTLSATAGTLNLTTTLDLIGGKISVPTLDIIANMNIGPFSTVTASNTITIQPGATVQLDGFSTLAATTSIANNGGTLALAGPLANVTGLFANNAGYVRGTGRLVGGLNNGAGGTIRAEIGDHLIIDTAAPTNAGTIELNGGTVEYSGALSNQATGVISGRGIYRGSSAAPGGAGLNNLGVLSFSAGITDIYGDVNNGASGKIVAAGASTVTFYDDVTNNGEIRTVAGSRTVFFGDVTGAGPFTGTGTVELEGDLKPGNSPANVTFGGNVEIGATAGLDAELGGATKGSQYDSLTIAGSASLSGGLDVSLINNFVPTSGQSFEILTAAGGINGTFDTASLPALAGGLYFNLAYSTTAVTLSVDGILGDYNKSGDIDGADYVVWRKTISLTGPALAADGNNNRTVDPADFAIWRANYGASASASGASGSAGAIPEPTALALCLLAAVSNTFRRQRR